jgi:hypothetical protein
MRNKDRLRTTCSRCGSDTECCDFCGEPECKHLMCYRCVRIALRQVVPNCHAHGG